MSKSSQLSAFTPSPKTRNKIFRSSSLKMKRTSSNSDLAAANTVKKIKQSVTMSATDSDAVMDGKPTAEGECCYCSCLGDQCSQCFLDIIISFVLNGCQQRSRGRTFVLALMSIMLMEFMSFSMTGCRLTSIHPHLSFKQ